MLRCSHRTRAPFGGCKQTSNRRPSAPRRSVQSNAIQIAEHAAYISEVAVSPCPKQLPALLRVFEAQGHSLLSPSDRKGLHPLVIPLAKLGSSSSSSDAASTGDVLGLLRWPQPNLHKGMTLPLVVCGREAPRLHLLARSAEEYLHRLLAEEDVASGPGGTLAAAAGPEAQQVYAAGGVAAAGVGDKFNMYLIRKVGLFPDVAEALAAGHLGRGDVTSALVASEWYMRNNHFPGWGRPYEYAAELYEQVGKREEERRDMARMALRQPWWSLSNWEQVRTWSEMRGSPAEVRYALSDEATAKATAAVTQFAYQTPKTSQEEALDKAAELMDLVAAGGDAAAGVTSSYTSILAPLAAQYEAAGLKDVANFVQSAQ